MDNTTQITGAVKVSTYSVTFRASKKSPSDRPYHWVEPITVCEGEKIKDKVAEYLKHHNAGEMKSDRIHHVKTVRL